MSGLKGNPHVFWGPQIAAPDTINEGFIAEEGITFETVILSELSRNTEATLALAYEQRTANLISSLRVLNLDAKAWPPETLARWQATVKELNGRLGVEVTK